MIWNFDPVALSVFGLDVRWYGLGYVVSFFLVLELGWRLLRTMSAHTISKKQWENLLFGMFVAGILGGRLGEFVFFSADILWENPMQVLYIWQGGMSIHGGIIGGSLYAWYFCRVHQLSLWRCFDAIALPLSIGLGVGRITNFINGELVGKPTHADWGVIFPHVDQLLRHPTQLYESLSMFLLAVFLFFMWKKSGKKTEAFMTSCFVVGYGVLRFVVEFWKDVPGVFFGFTMGQILCVVMIGLGGGLGLHFVQKSHAKNIDSHD